MTRYADGWPKSAEELLLLPEIPYDRYLRAEKIHECMPKEGVSTARDANRQLWKAIHMGSRGWCRVRLA